MSEALSLGQAQNSNYPPEKCVTGLLDVEHRLAIATRHGKVVLMKNGAVTSTIHLEVSSLIPKTIKHRKAKKAKDNEQNRQGSEALSLPGSQVAPCHAVEALAVQCC